MISVSEATKILQQSMPESGIEVISITEALGRVLAEQILAPLDSPQFDNSAMDGFAVKWDDIRPVLSGTPITLKLLGESRAGIPASEALKPGCAIRINTGGMMPAGADSVVPVEETVEEGDTVKILQVKKEGQHVRKQGEEFRKGDVLLEEGTPLEAPQLALLAHVGLGQIKVYAKPKISLIITGSELVAVGDEKAPYQIHDSNSHMLAALVKRAGGEVLTSGRVEDNLDATIAAIRKAETNSDMIIFSGGVSMGPHDHVKNAAAAADYETLFWKVKQKPGKPLFAAKKEGKLLVGLPGNPVSAFMGFVYYLYPLIRQMGRKKFNWLPVHMKLKDCFKNKSTRVQFVRVRLVKNDNGEPVVEKIQHQGSHMITSIAHSDGFLILKPEEVMEQGEIQPIYLYPWRTNNGIY
ncbi:MAG: molybdopterin molybdotransferase MoeA [Calditrichia bacterium]